MAIAAALLWCGSAFGEDEAKRAFDQAIHALGAGNYDDALARLDEAVRIDLKQAKFLGMRGVVWLRKGEYAKGSADLKAAIKLNPGDAGVEYRPSSGTPLSADALRHGQEQVAKMLQDRPAMAQFGEETEFLRQWAVRKFAGEDLGTLINWDPSPPLHSDAEHMAPSEKETAAILVAAVYDSGPKQGEPRSFEELWAGAVFELHNINNASEFVRLNDQADEGKISKRDFVAGILKPELRAGQQTRAFYVQVFLPWAANKKLPTDPTLWFGDWWDTPEKVLDSFADKSAYPWRPYARTHDWATVHYDWRQGEFREALNLLEQMCGEEGYEDDEGDVHYWMGRCWQRLGKPAEAIKALSDSIRLDPNSAPTFRARGKLYQQIGEKGKAEADFAKATELEKSR
jgi:tetratricopeptide (TPR) repeat protein